MDNPWKDRYFTFKELLTACGMSEPTVRRYLHILNIKPVELFASFAFYSLDVPTRILDEAAKPKNARGPRPAWTPNKIAKMVHWGQSNKNTELFHNLVRRIELQGLIPGVIKELGLKPVKLSSASGAMYSWPQVEQIGQKFGLVMD